MNAFKLAWRLSLRDWKSGQLGVLLFAITLAVTSLTAVGFLTDRVSRAVELRASESLAADLRLGSSQALDPNYLSLARQTGLRTASLTSMPTVIFAGEQSTLASIRAVSADYPLRGRIKISARLLAAATTTRLIPTPGEAWASARLMARLGIDTGSRVTVGRKSFLLRSVLDFRPDQGMQFIDLAPSLLINANDLAATALVQPGSRVSYRYLFAGKPAKLDQFKKKLQAKLKPGEQLRDINDVSPQIRSAMDRAARFLNLASLISVLLAAIAVAMAARRYAFGHRDRIALLKCLGSSQAYILKINLFQLLLLTIISALMGIFFGYFSQEILAWIARDLIAQQLPPPGMWPLGLGFITAIFILAGFALPDLIQLGKTPVLRVLRDDVEPPPLAYGLAYLAGTFAVLLLLQFLMNDLKLVLTIALGTVLTLLLLAMTGWLLVRASAYFRGAAGVAWRYGLANVNRRGRESIIQVVAFGLGLMVLMLLTLVRNDLMESWRSSLADNAPNQFMINIQPFEVPKIKHFLQLKGIGSPEFVPLVRARMTAINQVPVTALQFQSPQAERWTTRESNLSFSDTLQVGNEVLQGQWWLPGTTEHEVSIDQQFAADLELKIGDEMSFDIAGESVSATISSFRSIQWDSFMPNFFMVFSPATLKGFPASYISALYIEPKNERDLLQLMRQFPSVTVIDLDAALTQVRDVMDKAALAVQAVFIFTLLAGLAVLWAAVQASLDERAYESAILRTLGASRVQVLTAVGVEFVAIGLLAGLMASSVATLAAWQLSENIFELEYRFSIVIWVVGPFAGMLLVGFAGLLASWKVVRYAPVRVLASI